MSNKKIAEIVEEAAKLLRKNPHWTYKKAIETAKELIANEKYNNHSW